MLEIASRLTETTLTQNEDATLAVQLLNIGARRVFNISAGIEVRGPSSHHAAPNDPGPLADSSKVSISPASLDIAPIEPNEWSASKNFTVTTDGAERGDYTIVLNLQYEVVGKGRSAQSVQIMVEED